MGKTRQYLVFGCSSRTYSPSSVQRLIQHQCEIVSLKQANGRSGPLHNWRNVFTEDIVHDGANLTECSRTITQFPQEAVHLVQRPADFSGRPKQFGKPPFDASKLFGYSQDHASSSCPGKVGVLFNRPNPCPPNRCSAGVLFSERMVINSCQRFHSITSKFSPGPNQQCEHGGCAKKGGCSGCLHAC